MEWLGEPAQSERAAASHAQLLKRVFGEQFEVLAGQSAALEKEKETVVAEITTELIQAQQAAVETAAVDPQSAPPASPAAEGSASPGAETSGQSEFAAEAMAEAARIEPKGKGQLSSDRVQNPHDPEATYAVNAWGRINGTARWWSASTTRSCKPGGKSNGPTLSSNG